MPYRKVLFTNDQYFHIYNRGNNHEKIFFERENYAYFLRLIHEHLPQDKTEMIAYCLMPTHYHFLGHTKSDDLSRQMQSFLLAYTKAINVRFKRTGALFQGRFKAKLITNNEVLLHLSRYIHLNPVVAGLVPKAEEWEFSSYRDYLGLRNGTLPKPDVILNQFSSREDYRIFVESEPRFLAFGGKRGSEFLTQLFVFQFLNRLFQAFQQDFNLLGQPGWDGE